MTLRPYPVAAFAGWTLLSWSGRLDLAGGVEAPIVVFLALGLAVAATVVTGRATTDAGRRLVQAASIWTVGYWAVRLALILGRDYSVGFKVVHAMLAVVAAGLAVWAWRSVRSATPAGSAGLADSVR